VPKRRSAVDAATAESAIFTNQVGLATRAQLLQHGLSEKQIWTAVARGRWLRPAPGLYALANWPDVPTRGLLGACLMTGGVASHGSAAWLWGLLPEEPAPTVVSVPHERHSTRSGRQHGPLPPGFPDPSALVVHRSRDLAKGVILTWRGVPTTNPLRSLVDMAADAPSALLDDAVDAAISTRLVSVEALLAEAARLKRSGRSGPAELTRCLKRRGFVGGLSSSVLESRALRLLARAGIKVVACEVAADDHRYRLDIELEGRVFVELDGYAYHWSPEQKRHDDARRNRLRLLGFEVLVYDWQSVVNERRRVVTEVRKALRANGKPQIAKPKGAN
jgi:hypothetical protein